MSEGLWGEAISGHPRRPEYRQFAAQAITGYPAYIVHYFYVITEGPRLFLEAY